MALRIPRFFIGDSKQTSLETTQPSSLAFDLLRELRAEDRGKNVFFSPASITICLHMLLAGATGETREAMERVLDCAGLEAEVIRQSIENVRSAFRCTGPSLQLEMANALWCAQQVSTKREYLERIRDQFGADISNVDFADPSIPDLINSWVSKKTHGKIGKMVQSFHPLTVLVAANAVYFKDAWAHKFEMRATEELPFFLASGSQVRVPLMSQRGTYSYHQESGFQAVRLPFDTDRLAMYVFLPAENSNLGKFVEKLYETEWDKWIRRMDRRKGMVCFPRFKFETSYELKTALQRLGMGAAMDADARFDGICTPPPIWISQVLHRAFVEVNEVGAEAAAATVVVMVAKSMYSREKDRSFVMVVNRPFFFAIRDDQTGTVLFMGAVEDPRT
jgi:serpin B